jgi:enterochelin esterase-like enzyme
MAPQHRQVEVEQLYPQLPIGVVAAQEAPSSWEPFAPALTANGDLLFLTVAVDADEVHAFGGVQGQLDRVGPLWVGTWRVRDLARCALSVSVSAVGPNAPAGGAVDATVTWIGPAAVDLLPEVDVAPGTIRRMHMPAAALGGVRDVEVFQPPGTTGTLPVCLLADGQGTEHIARVLGPAIAAGTVAPLLLAGIHNGWSPDAIEYPDLRNREYVPSIDPARFTAHLEFITGEVVPMLCRNYDVVAPPWTVAGFSSGAVWALETAARRPDIAGHVVALSPGVPTTPPPPGSEIVHVIGGGRLEPNFHQVSIEIAKDLRAKGFKVHEVSWDGGHDPLWWRQLLVHQLA